MDHETVVIVGNTKDAAEFIDGKYDSVGRSGRRSCRHRCLVGNAAIVGVRVGDEHIGSITVHHGLGRRGMAVLVIHDIYFMMLMMAVCFMHTRFPKHQRRIKYMNSNNDDDDDGEAVAIQLFVVVVLICLLPPRTKRR